MHYSEEEQLYEMEKMMRSVPNFTPRKHGSIVPNGLDNPDDLSHHAGGESEHVFHDITYYSTVIS